MTLIKNPHDDKGIILCSFEYDSMHHMLMMCSKHCFVHWIICFIFCAFWSYVLCSTLLRSIQCIACILSYQFYSMNCMLLIIYNLLFFSLYAMHCIACNVFFKWIQSIVCMHFMYYVSTIIPSMHCNYCIYLFIIFVFVSCFVFYLWSPSINVFMHCTL